MAADKSLSPARQPPDNDGMTRTQPKDVTLAQWLAVLAVWGLAAYGAFAAPRQTARPDRVQLIACH